MWASRRQESPCSSLVRHSAAWNHQWTPFQQRLGAQMGTVLLLVWLIVFSNMVRKVVDFQGLLLGAFFVPVFGLGLLTCAAKVPISGPKIWTPSRGQKHNSHCNYLCPLLWRPVALELWSGSMNVCWVVLPRKTRQDQVTHSEVKQQADMRLRRRGGYSTSWERIWVKSTRMYQKWNYLWNWIDKYPDLSWRSTKFYRFFEYLRYYDVITIFYWKFNFRFEISIKISLSGE